jgi:hypothetical protein
VEDITKVSRFNRRAPGACKKNVVLQNELQAENRRYATAFKTPGSPARRAPQKEWCSRLTKMSRLTRNGDPAFSATGRVHKSKLATCIPFIVPAWERV